MEEERTVELNISLEFKSVRVCKDFDHILDYINAAIPDEEEKSVILKQFSTDTADGSLVIGKDVGMDYILLYKDIDVAYLFLYKDPDDIKNMFIETDFKMTAIERIFDILDTLGEAK